MPHLQGEINLKTSIVPASRPILTPEDAPLSLAENLSRARKTRSCRAETSRSEAGSGKAVSKN